MVSRRALLVGGTGVLAAAAVGGAASTDRLDDALRALGVEPKPEPDPGDVRLVRQARADADALLAQAREASAPDAVVAALEQQRDALPPGGSGTSALPGDLAAACASGADARAAGARAAVSVELAQVLASMSAGLDQCATYLARR